MLRQFTRLCLLMALVFGTAMSVGLTLARGQGTGLAAMYGYFAPYDDHLTLLYIDVHRGVRVSKDAPAHVLTTFFNGTLSPDRTLRVRSMPSPDNLEIFIVENGEIVRQLTDLNLFPPETGSFVQRANVFPAWSPDGQWILFLSAAARGRLDLFAIRPDGKDLRALSQGLRLRTVLRPRWVALPSSTPLSGLAGLGLCGLAWAAWVVRRPGLRWEW